MIGSHVIASMHTSISNDHVAELLFFEKLRQHACMSIFVSLGNDHLT